MSPFLSGWPARYLVWLTSMVLLLFQHTFLPISIWMLIIYSRVGCFQSGIFSLRWLKQLFTFGVYQRWTCWHPPIPLNASIFTPCNSTICWSLGVECLQPSLDISGKLCVSSSHISSSSTVQVSGRTCQRSTPRLLIMVAPCWMEESPWLPTVLNILADIPWQCPIIKDLIMEVLVGHVLKGLPYLNLMLWLLRDVCYTDKGSLPLSARQWWGNFSIYIKGLLAVLEGIGRLVCSRRCTKNAI